MRFSVLGPLQVTTSTGKRIDVGSAKLRTLLIALLCRANQQVPSDWLIGALWGYQPPHHAGQSLRVYVHHLRRIVGSDRIVRRPSGYEILVNREDLDANDFLDTTAAARRLAASGDLNGAQRAYRQALALWRGRPYEGIVGEETIDAAATRLGEHRLAAYEECFEVELTLGRHHEVITELAALVAETPLRERLRAQLMLALVRDGRRGDALVCFDEARRMLRSELGVEPCQPLQDLHLQILRDEPALYASAAVPTHPAESGQPGDDLPWFRPAQLPRRITDFIGREADLKMLDQVLADTRDRGDMGIAAITGAAGIGKTALAVHWAHKLADDFPDGRLYVDLRGFGPEGSPISPAAALNAILDAFRVPGRHRPTDLAALAGMYRSLLADRRVLVLLDNARDAAQVRPLLPGSPGCLVVVTSRTQLAGLVADGAVPVMLDPLTVPEARALMARRLGGPRASAEPDALDEIIACCAGLPLALAVVAGRATTYPEFPLAALAAKLRDSRNRLDVLDGGDAAADVRAVFSWSYRTLGDAAARLFRLLGCHPATAVTIPAAASLARLSADKVEALLIELVRTGLISATGPGHFALHDLVHVFAAELAHAHDRSGHRRSATHRLLDHYLHSAYAAARLLSPRRDPISLTEALPGVVTTEPANHDQALRWFIAKGPVLIAAVELAAAAGFDTHAWQLAWTLAEYLDQEGKWHHWIATQTTALRAAVRGGDLLGQAVVHRSLALAMNRTGHNEAAQGHGHRALELFADLGDRPRQAWTHFNLGVICEHQGNYKRALSHARRALSLFDPTGSDQEQSGRARILNVIGWNYGMLGQYERTVSYCQLSLALLTRIGDRASQAATWDSIGYAHHHLGNHAEAIACYQNAIDLFAEFGYPYYEASVLIHFGDTQQAAGKHDAAHDAWQRALDIFTGLAHPDAERARARLQAAYSGPGSGDCPSPSADRGRA